jgi:hypothetical protein
MAYVYDGKQLNIPLEYVHCVYKSSCWSNCVILTMHPDSSGTQCKNPQYVATDLHIQFEERPQPSHMMARPPVAENAARSIVGSTEFQVGWKLPP